jgi:hypothetical protein
VPTPAAASTPGIPDGSGIVTRVRDLRAGDMITEIDSPAGPWYEVVRRDERSVTLDARLRAGDPPLLVSIEYSEEAAVLRHTG